MTRLISEAGGGGERPFLCRTRQLKNPNGVFCFSREVSPMWNCLEEMDAKLSVAGGSRKRRVVKACWGFYLGLKECPQPHVSVALGLLT